MHCNDPVRFLLTTINLRLTVCAKNESPWDVYTTYLRHLAVVYYYNYRGLIIQPEKVKAAPEREPCCWLKSNYFVRDLAAARS